MPRVARLAPAGAIFHVLNRGVGRRVIFSKDEDFAAFERVLAYALEIEPVRLFAYCLMPNHWHLLLSPRETGQLGRFMQRLTMTHTRRWQEHYHEVGYGHLYQGRFKSFPVQDDGHFLTVARYVERNALRARLVKSAAKWKWSSLGRRSGMSDPRVQIPLATWPMSPGNDWPAHVDRAETAGELAALRKSLSKGRPFGSPGWEAQMVQRLGLHASQRDAGRPKGTVKKRWN